MISLPQYAGVFIESKDKSDSLSGTPRHVTPPASQEAADTNTACISQSSLASCLSQQSGKESKSSIISNHSLKHDVFLHILLHKIWYTINCTRRYFFGIYLLLYVVYIFFMIC